MSRPTVTELDGGVLIDIPDLTFSSPTIRAAKKPTAAQVLAMVKAGARDGRFKATEVGKVRNALVASGFDPAGVVRLMKRAGADGKVSGAKLRRIGDAVKALFAG